MAGSPLQPAAKDGGPVENSIHIHDLQATILHLLGLNHTQLTYRFQGRDFRLTDVAGKVVEGDPSLSRLSLSAATVDPGLH